MSKSKIPYTEYLWETVGGCTKCSPGCQNCYSIPLVGNRLSHNPRYDGLVKNKNWTGKIKLFEDRLEQPRHWRAPRTIFVNPRSDTFHPDVPFEFVDKMFAVMALCPQHKFLVLTKRPDRMVEYINTKNRWKNHVLKEAEKIHGPWQTPLKYYWPQPHIIHMTTICNQEEADRNIPLVLQIQGAKLGLSIEPMLGPVDIQRYLTYGDIDWVVVGCESGPNRRPCKLEWIESIVNQCKAAGVKCYVKQIDLDGKVEKDINKFPKQVRVRDKI